MRQGDQFQTSFGYFLKKLFMRSKQVVRALVSIYFDSPRLGHTIKTNCIKLQTVDPKICAILIFQKRVLEQFLLFFHRNWFRQNKKSFQDEMKSIIHHFIRAFSSQDMSQILQQIIIFANDKHEGMFQRLSSSCLHH